MKILMTTGLLLMACTVACTNESGREGDEGRSMDALRQELDDLAGRVEVVEGRAPMPGFEGPAGEEGPMGAVGPRGPAGPAGPPGDPNAGVESGEAMSDGCVAILGPDGKMERLECAACSTHSCTVTPLTSGVPAETAATRRAWMWGATFKVIMDGTVEVDVGRSLVCDRRDELAGKDIGIDLSMQIASTLGAATGPDPSLSIPLGHATARRVSAPSGLFAFAEAGLLRGRLDTRVEDVVPGSVWAILVSLEPSDAAAAGCHLVEAPVVLRFTPAPAPTVDISH